MSTATDTKAAPVRSSRPRSSTERLVDAVSTRRYRLPPQRGPYSVTPAIPVPMRDGVHLLTDHYSPDGPAFGTVLLRGPYQRAGIGPHLLIGLFASRGYHVVMQSCRGTFGSEGRFVPGEHDVDDGADTMAWLRDQPWFDGRFVGVGASYLSYTLWAMLMDPPPEMVAAVSMVSFHDFFYVVHGTGAFTVNDTMVWCDSLARQERSSMLVQVVEGALTKRRLAPAFVGLPVAEGEERFLQSGQSWYRDWCTRTDPDDPYWQRRDFTPALDRVDVPVLLVSGWQDLFLPQTLDEYRRLHDRGVDVALTVGPWTHAELFSTEGGARILGDTLDWVDRHLGGPAGAARPDLVSLYFTGADDWRSASEWPPAADDRTFHLAPGGVLADEAPSPTAGSAAFTFDPSDPTPTLGGRLLALGSGYQEDSNLARRADTLVFVTPPLGEPMEVVGVPRVTVAHRSDPPGGDLWVRVSEVSADGRSHNVTEGFRASCDGALALDPVAHRFAAGSRIGLLVGGGSYPRYARNLGMPGARNEGTAMVPTRQTLDLSSGACALTLPVPRPASGRRP